MFENIIGQDNVIDMLKEDVVNNSLSNSMMFYGQESVGKLTTAFELLRILNCLKDRHNECRCSNCKRIKDLDFEGLIFLSRRNFTQIITELVSAYKRKSDLFILNKLKKITKLLTLPLQDFIITSSFNESDKKEIGNLVNSAFDIIFKENISALDLEKLPEISNKINSKYKKKNIPVDSVREMLDWTYISNPDINRVVIIDHVDYLEKSSQNILLKRLEEPTRNLFFILLAEKRNMIVNTILSRCRCYSFKSLDKENVNQIIKNEFNVEGEYDSVNNYLLRNDEASYDAVLPVIDKILKYTFVKEATYMELISLLNGCNDRKVVKSILNHLIIILEKELLRRQVEINEEIEFKVLKNISIMNIDLLKNNIVKKYNNIEKYSLNPVLVLEGLFYPLKAMVQNDEI